MLDRIKNLLTKFQQQLPIILSLFPVMTIVIQRTPGISFISILFYIYCSLLVLATILLKGVRTIHIPKSHKYFYFFIIQVFVYLCFYRTTYLADFVPLSLFFTTVIFISLSVTKKNIQYLIAGIIFAYFVVLGIALIEFLTGIYLFNPAAFFTTHQAFRFFHIPVVTFHNTNNLSYFFLLAAPLVMTRFKKQKALNFSITALTFLIIAACQSTIGMVIYPLYFLWNQGLYTKFKALLTDRPQLFPNRESKIFFWAIIASGLTIIYPYIMKIPMIYVRVNVFFLYMTSGLTHIVFGSGFGASIRLAANNWMHLPPHNFFVYVLYDYGVFGLFFVVFTLYLCLKKIKMKHFYDNKYVRALFESAVLFVVVVHIIPSGVYSESITWILFGLLLAIASPYFTKKSQLDIKGANAMKSDIQRVEVAHQEHDSLSKHIPSRVNKSRVKKRRGE